MRGKYQVLKGKYQVLRGKYQVLRGKYQVLKGKFKVLIETLPLEPNRRIRIFLRIWIQGAKMSQIRILSTAIASNKHNHNKDVNLIFLVDFPEGSVSRTSFDPSKAGRIGISVSKYP